MIKVIWIGNPYIQEELKFHGWDVVHIPTSRMDCPLPWEKIREFAPFHPDLVVLGDESLPPILLNVEEFPCLTLFYCVDSHIHSWYPEYAQSFDLVTVAMRDHIPNFTGPALREHHILWLPPYATKICPETSLQKTMDMVFVGKNDPEVTPKRYELLIFLRQHYPSSLSVIQGDFTQWFPKAKVVLNISEYGDLNFRVFEALACKSCLLTPQVGHGLSELFSNTEDLLMYDQDNRISLLSSIDFLLKNPDVQNRMAVSGYEKTISGHLPKHRAKQLAAWVDEQDMGSLRRIERTRKKNIVRQVTRPLYLHWAESIQSQQWKKAYVSAAKNVSD